LTLALRVDAARTIGVVHSAALNVETIARVWVGVALLLGFALLAVAVTYWALPADRLPDWLPGHKPRSHPPHDHHHKRHGLVAFVLGVGYLSGAYLLGRGRNRR
jgi:hypothetical protein